MAKRITKNKLKLKNGERDDESWRKSEIIIISKNIAIF
jgi:hypothetical protein